MNGINKVIIIGTLGKDVEVRHTQAGKAVANLSLATSEKWKDKQGQQQEKTEWHKVVMFDRLAEIAQQYLSKGSKCYIEGKLQTRKWQDQNGQDRYSTEILANNMQMLGVESTARTEPQRAPQQQAQAQPQQAQHQQSNGSIDLDDDIPF